MSKSKNIIRQRGQIALVLTLISAGLMVAGVLTGSLIAQKATPGFTTTAAGNTWSQCKDPHNSSTFPCGSCGIKSVGPGTMTFGCELDCGGSTGNCPGGSAGTYTIAHRWERCKKAGTSACGGWATGDYIESGDLGGSGPWTIKGQSLVNGNGTFPDPGCGRVQVDVQMNASGTNVAGLVYNTGKDCTGTTPLPTNTPGQPQPTNTPSQGRPTATPTPTPILGSCGPLAVKGVCIKNNESCPEGSVYLGEAPCYLNGIIASDQKCCVKKTEALSSCLQKYDCYNDNAQICCEGTGLKKITYLKDPNFSYPSCTKNSDTKGFCLQCSSDLECIKGDEVCCPGYAPMALDNLGTYLHLPSFLNCRSKGYEHVCLKAGIPSEAALESSSRGVSGIKLGTFDPTEYNKVILQSWTTGNLNATDISRQINEYSTNYSIQMRSCYPNLPVSDPNSCR